MQRSPSSPSSPLGIPPRPAGDAQAISTAVGTRTGVASDIGTRILLVVCGAIAAYRSLDCIRHLRRRGFNVRCLMTKQAGRFITPLSLDAMSSTPVCRADNNTPNSATEGDPFAHVSLARWADIVAVYPATANTLAKLANGIADDTVSSTLLACTVPIILAPSMNAAMWQHPATRGNLARLVANGARILPPDTGELACGEWGEGRLVDPLAAADAIQAALYFGHARPLAGSHVIVTSGATEEPFDAVRYLTNRSSGRQGNAVACAAVAAGARVTLISGRSDFAFPCGVQVHPARTATAMRDAAMDALPADIAICVAAITDWNFATVHDGKFASDKSAALHPTLHPNPDCLATLSRASQRPRIVVGFAAEYEQVIKNAERKRVDKACDWIVANDVSNGDADLPAIYGAECSQVHIIGPHGTETLPVQHKVANACDLIARLAGSDASSGEHPGNA